MSDPQARHVHWEIVSNARASTDDLSITADAGNCHGPVQRGTEGDDVDRNWRPSLTSLQRVDSVFRGMNSLELQALTLMKADLTSKK